MYQHIDWSKYGDFPKSKYINKSDFILIASGKGNYMKNVEIKYYLSKDYSSILIIDIIPMLYTNFNYVSENIIINNDDCEDIISKYYFKTTKTDIHMIFKEFQRRQKINRILNT